MLKPVYYNGIVLYPDILVGHAGCGSIFPWGGVTQTYLKPIYLDLVAMSGLIAGCTCYITEVIKEVNSNHSLNTNDEK